MASHQPRVKDTNLLPFYFMTRRTGLRFEFLNFLVVIFNFLKVIVNDGAKLPVR
jgi:hypothetical protein